MFPMYVTTSAQVYMSDITNARRYAGKRMYERANTQTYPPTHKYLGAGVREDEDGGDTAGDGADSERLQSRRAKTSNERQQQK